MRKKTDAGFTLIELVVTLVCCSIVTLAVMTVLLTGTRIGRAAEKSSGEQQNVRIVLTALENMISDGTVSKVQQLGDDWQLLRTETDGDGNETDSVLLSYSGAQGALLTSGGTPLLEGLTGATAKVNDSLLTVSVKVDGEEYTTSVYCRLGASNKDGEALGSTDKIKTKVDTVLPDSSSEATYPARKAFLLKLASQYGSSGKIIGEDLGSTFSKWYCGGSYRAGWDENTPWCAIFLSWALEDTKGEINADRVPKFSNVNEGAKNFGWKTENKSGAFGSWKTNAPTPGDLIFFDWEQDGDPDHVGAVLFVDTNGGIYTIEGNSAGKVAVRFYASGDARIIGYGVLNWKETNPTT